MAKKLTCTSLPEAQYLNLVGQLVYEVGSVEWLIMGDISKELTSQDRRAELAKLAAKTTNQLGKRLQIIAPSLGEYKPLAQRGGEVLIEVAGLRNSVLHARPATDTNGSQRLYRWAPTKHETFMITGEELQDRIRRIGEWSSELENLRPMYRK